MAAQVIGSVPLVWETHSELLAPSPAPPRPALVALGRQLADGSCALSLVLSPRPCLAASQSLIPFGS